MPEAKEELAETDVTVFNEDVIYTILEKYDEWYEITKQKLDRKRRQTYTHPGMIKILPEYIFRVSHPAIFGVRILAGRIHQDMRLMREDGKIIGRIKAIQEDNQSVEEAKQGAEVAVSVDGITIKIVDGIVHVVIAGIGKDGVGITSSQAKLQGFGQIIHQCSL